MSRLKKEIKNILLPGGSAEVIEALLTYPPDKLYGYCEELEKRIIKVKNGIFSKQEIYRAFDYDGRISRNKTNAYELSKRIGTRTCVYCNRVYSFTVEDSDGVAICRPDFDHWLPKKEHPLLSMSFYNLIPSCPICNRSVKLRSEFEYGKHVHPYGSGKEMQAKFQYEPSLLGQWKLKLAGATDAEKETASILKTEDVYQPYANGEVKDILDFAYDNPPEYLMDLKEKVLKAKIAGNSISKERAYRLVFGTELDSSLFLDRPLSKLKYDVLKQLQEDLKISIMD